MGPIHTLFVATLLLFVASCSSPSYTTTDTTVSASLPDPSVPDIHLPIRKEWAFSNEAIGNAPSGFKLADGSWKILTTKDMLVLGQTEHNSKKINKSHAVVDASHYRDLAISANLRGVTGSGLQGIVWRYKDPENHYVAWTSPKAVYLGVVENGTMQILAKRPLKWGLNPFHWHELEVEHERDRIRIYCDNQKLAEISGETCERLEHGKVGFFTQKTSAWFKQLRVITYPDEEAAAN